jgi:hypothetical protein
MGGDHNAFAAAAGLPSASDHCLSMVSHHSRRAQTEFIDARMREPHSFAMDANNKTPRGRGFT